jgi:hypothetical protein
MIVVSRSRRIDWPRLVVNLQSTGMSHRDIARAVDVSKGHVAAWADPAGVVEPAFWSGAQLLQLWAQKTGLRWTDAPVRVVMPSVSAVLRDAR